MVGWFVGIFFLEKITLKDKACLVGSGLKVIHQLCPQSLMRLNHGSNHVQLDEVQIMVQIKSCGSFTTVNINVSSANSFTLHVKPSVKSLI